MGTQRLLYLDAMKGILIILVIVGHTVQFNINDFQHNFVFRFIYSFHMPLFFMISGYLTYKKEYAKTLIRKRAMQLLIPFVVWAFLLSSLETGAFDWSRTCRILLYPDNGLWFLYNLFVYCVLFNLSERFSNQKIRQEWIVWIGISLCYCAGILFKNKFNCTPICWYLPFFAMGYYVRKYEHKLQSSNRLIVVFGGGYFLTMPFWMMRESPLFYQWIDLGVVFSYLYRYAVQIMGATFFFFVGKYFLNKYIPFINDIGQKTLGIYAFQFVVLYHLGKLLQVESHMTKIILETVIAILVCYVIVTVIQRIKYLRLLLIGNS